MYTKEEISIFIHPVPQQVTLTGGKALQPAAGSKWNVTAPQVEKGPALTAAKMVEDFLKNAYGEDCLSPDGIPVKLTLEAAPAAVKTCQKEGYRLSVKDTGIEIAGFGEEGLYYGALSLTQLRDLSKVPAVEVLDWPDNPSRIYKEECRYGSNLMEKEDWFALVDDLSSKKMNKLCIALYGCWVVQFDDKVAEYLYLPLKDYPQLKTPQQVRYYSPTEGKWIAYETLPPMYRDDFFGEVVRYAKDHAVEVIPGFNSFGHNTLFPANLPEVAPKDENGGTVPSGFCTSSEDTYKLLFSAYDQIIDDFLLPNDIHSFNIMLDEVMDEAGTNAARKYEVLSPWCKCEKCRTKEKKDIFIDHVIKTVSYLRDKGMTTVILAHDMLIKNSYSMGFIGDELKKRLEEADLMDVVCLGWWCYVDHMEQMAFDHCHDELGLRSTCNPWNGYYIWSALLNTLGNVKIMADLNEKAARGEGVYLYSMWDKSCDRVHDCAADYAWNYHGSGELKDVTERYVARNYPTLYEKALWAYRQIDYISEDRMSRIEKDNVKFSTVCRYGALMKTFTYYSYCYFDPNKPYPRHFPGEALEKVLRRRELWERELYSMVAQSREAIAILKEVAATPGCNREKAERMIYECTNYLCLSEDWLALMEIYDLTQGGDQKKIAPIARKRHAARLETMALMERTKEKWAREGAAMRDLSVLMQVFDDIVKYIESTDDPKLDLMDITPIMSPESFAVR